MIDDPTEEIRRARKAELDLAAADRAALETKYGAVYDTKEMQALYAVQGFAAPFVIVEERATGRMGSLEFQHYPRFYFNWLPDKPLR
jgi:hypothetical protein